MATIYNLEPGKLFSVPKTDEVTVCKLCHLPAVPYKDHPEIDLGDLYQYGKPVEDEDGKPDIEVYCAHYFCLLFSPGLNTNGEDEEGIRGFLPEDILKEWRRGARLKCTFCDKKYATIGCHAGKRCRQTYHLPCGILNGAHIEFCGGFASYCREHRPIQDIYSKPGLLDEPRECGVCLDTLPTLSTQSLDERCHTLHTPCCGGWFHKSCAQRAAMTSGYFFKCPLCNNKEKFESEMKKFGVYVPEQDAAWELEGDQFEDQYERHDRCDAEDCICPEGRHKDEDYTIWEILLCRLCGAQGCHVQCANLELRNDVTWKCPGCKEVVKKLPPTITHNFRKVDMKGKGTKSSQEKAMIAAIQKTSIQVNVSNGDLTFSIPLKKTTASVSLKCCPKYDIPNRVKLFSEPKVDAVKQAEESYATKSDDPEVSFKQVSTTSLKQPATNKSNWTTTENKKSSTKSSLPVAKNKKICKTRDMTEDDDPEVVFITQKLTTNQVSTNPPLKERRRPLISDVNLASRKRHLIHSTDSECDDAKENQNGKIKEFSTAVLFQKLNQNLPLKADKITKPSAKKLKKENDLISHPVTPKQTSNIKQKSSTPKSDPKQKSILHYFMSQAVSN